MTPVTRSNRFGISKIACTRVVLLRKDKAPDP